MGTYQEGLQCFSKFHFVFCFLWTEDYILPLKCEWGGVTLKLRFLSFYALVV